MEGWPGGSRYRGPPRLGVHPEVSGEHSSVARALVEAKSREKRHTGLGPDCNPTGRPPHRALSPRPQCPRPTNNAPARPPACAALTTQVRAPSAPARLDLAMAAPPVQARGCSRSGDARSAARTDRCASHSLAAPHRGPEPLRRPRRPPPSNSSAAPGPRARPRARKAGGAARPSGTSAGERGPGGGTRVRAGWLGPAS